MAQSIVIALAVVTLLVTVVLRFTSARGNLSPPGPAGHPIIGHTLQVLKSRPYEVFSRWGEQYGPLISAKIYGKTVIVINDFALADDLLNKRGGAFSDRPFRVAAHLCEYDRALAFMPKGERTRRTRRQMHAALNSRVVPSQLPHLEAATRDFCSNIASTPQDLHGHIHQLFTGTILSFTLGYDVESRDDPILTLSERVGHNAMSMMTPSPKFWFELLPFFKYLPLWSTGPVASGSLYKFRQELRRLLAFSEEHAQMQLQGNFPPSFLSNLLKSSLSEEDKNIALYSSVSLYGGAVDTTISLTTSFFMAMMKYPNCQTIAQAEIDSVVGRQRLPKAEDRAALPYTEALITELLRWAPPIPLTSRPLDENQIYNGYLLPKRSTVIGNIWGMTHNQAQFSHPEQFLPERFYDTSKGNHTQLETAAKDIRRIVFGFGQRVCPGRFYADAWLWLTLSSVLALFKVSPPGGTSAPEATVIDGAILQLESFPCDLILRYEGALELARSYE